MLGLPSLLPAFLRGGRSPSAGLLNPRRTVENADRSANVEAATRNFLLYAAVPMWQAAGLADWYCHRKTRIEQTSGTRESALHALMLTEAGLPALMGIFLEVNAGVLLAMIAAVVAHEATAVWDVAYAEPRRRTTTAEQHVHSFLEVGPVLAAAFLGVLHWDQAAALLHRGGKKPGFALRLKRKPLSLRSTAGLLAALALFGGLPYAEEFVRCLRVDPSLRARPAPAQPETPTLRIPG